MTRRNWPKGFTLLSHVSRSPTSIGRRRYVAVVSASTSNRKKEKTQVVKKKERGVEMILIKDHRSNKNTKTIKKMQATEAVSSPDGNIMKKKTVKTSKTKNTSSSNRCIRPPEPEGFSEDGSDNYSLPRGITMRPSGKWQTQFYFAGQSRYIGVFASRFVACTAYEVVRNFLQTKKPPVGSQLDKEKASKIFRQARIAGHEAVGLEL